MNEIESCFAGGFSVVSPFSVFIRLSLAVLLGGAIGLERGFKHQAAGFRTYMIVSLGSALIMITSEFLLLRYRTGDPARLGAQIISGIGFLGAGSIMVSNMQIKGITTAAGLWAAASIGLAVGAGFFLGPVIAVAFLLVIMAVMGKLDVYLYRYSRAMLISAEFQSMEYLAAFIKKLRDRDCVVADIDIKDLPVHTQYVGAVIKLLLPKPIDHVSLIESMSKAEGLEYIIEL